MCFFIVLCWVWRKCLLSTKMRYEVYYNDLHLLAHFNFVKIILFVEIDA